VACQIPFKGLLPENRQVSTWLGLRRTSHRGALRQLVRFTYVAVAEAIRGYFNHDFFAKIGINFCDGLVAAFRCYNGGRRAGAASFGVTS
jgi:hypothetical protein